LEIIINLPELSAKSKQDSIANIISFGIFGTSGIVLIAIIAQKYDAQTLGVFNLTYSLYILLSQIVGGGIHFSVLEASSRYCDDIQETPYILTAGLCASAFCAFSFLCLFYIANSFLYTTVRYHLIASSVYLVLPGLLFYVMNKVLLAYHNGHSRMVAYAVFNSLRSILLISFLIICIAMAVNGFKLAIIFTATEFILFILLITYTMTCWKPKLGKRCAMWMKRHAVFGAKAAVGGFVIDVNSRIDVLILGLFASPHTVGIYSFIAMIADGFSQIAFVFRAIINPKLTELYKNKGRESLANFIKRGGNIFYVFMSALGLIILLSYPLMINLLSLEEAYLKAGWVLLILIMGSLVSMGYSPFFMVLNQTGHPGEQSVLFSLIFGTNIILNLIFTPLFGMAGAGAAVSLTFVMSVFYLKNIVKKTLGIYI